MVNSWHSFYAIVHKCCRSFGNNQKATLVLWLRINNTEIYRIIIAVTFSENSYKAHKTKDFNNSI